MLKRNLCLLIVVFFLFVISVRAQNVAINATGALPDSNAILDVSSSSKGMLIPRLSTASRLALQNTAGLLVYDTATHSIWYNTGAAWQNLSGKTLIGTNWLLTGNSGTDTSCFLGTIDSVALKIKVNNKLSGNIDPFMQNTFWGYKAGFSHVTSLRPSQVDSAEYPGNTGVGHLSLYSNVTGEGNTAIGSYSLFSNQNYYNTATGSHSLYFNTTGGSNTASGDYSLYFNTSGSSNTATGSVSMFHNTAGAWNTATGDQSMYGNTIGYGNTSTGFNSLYSNTTGYYNTATG